ncbi:MAG: hypothetical protein NT027_11305 [Proteobacteria bacterium]|nr:hypothetical protein [Pseudomonadota bacterium]
MILWIFKIFIPLFLLGSWVALTRELNDPEQLKMTTEKSIKANDQLIQMYVRKYGAAPTSMNELRFYAKSKGREFVVFDSWGERLEFLPLGKINYTLRSFGADGIQNTLETESDPGVFRWGQAVEKGLQYDFEKGPNVMRPSVVLFAGADDQSRRWHAKLFLDQVTGARKLLVRHKTKTKLFMLAGHDAIEEFLWLPSGDRLIFTASGSARYGDGLWIWDLKSDQMWNLFELESDSGGYNPATKAKSLHIALAYVSGDNRPRVGVYVANGAVSPVNPTEFFGIENLIEYEIQENDKIARIPKREASDSYKAKSTYFDYSWLTRGTISGDGLGSNMQRVWLNLPRTGNWEEAMQYWQDFASKNAQSPLAAYSIWALSMFYADASKAHRTSHPSESEALRSFSNELNGALHAMVSAPGWMRAIDQPMREKDK